MGPFVHLADPDVGWRLLAECDEQSAHLFTPDQRESRRQRALRERSAKAICGRCPVARECLRYGLDSGDSHSIWGGLSPEELRAAARAQALELAGAIGNV